MLLFVTAKVQWLVVVWLSGSEKREEKEKPVRGCL